MKVKDSQITVSVYKLASYAVGVVVTTLITASFSYATVVNRDHFIVLANSKDIKILQETSVSKEVYERDITELKTLIATSNQQIRELAVALNQEIKELRLEIRDIR